MKKQQLILIIFLFVSFFTNAQNPLPRNLSEEEKEFLASENFAPTQNFLSNPPPGEVRTPAEWEEMQSVIITWQGFNSILADIVINLKNDVEIIIVCDNANTVENYLQNKGIDISQNVKIIEVPSNSIWVRDYGPNSGYLTETGELVWIDWIYNRPRYKDDQVPVILGAKLGIPVYESASAPEDLVNTGGNFMSDGMGNGFSSDLVLDENGSNNQFGMSNHSESDVDAIMEKYMGIKQYLKMEALPFDLIHHIDMHMKMIDEETILVGEYPEGIADGPQIEANIQYILNNLSTAYGRTFKIKRIPMPPGPNGKYPNQGGDYRTYANALIANTTVILPTYSEQYDTTAIRIWKEIMPGYNIKGINCNSIIPLSGALHCITKEVAVNNPITINMAKNEDWCINEPFIISATAHSNFPISSVILNYSINGQSSTKSMELNIDGSYSFNLGFLNESDIVTYFINVTDESGKSINRPIVGENGPRVTKIINCNVTSTYETDFSLTKIYPNPARSITCIELDAKNYGAIEISLLNMNGHLVTQIFKGESKARNNKFFFDASSLVHGTYILKIQSNSAILFKKLIVY